jgi:hypothetical protein
VTVAHHNDVLTLVKNAGSAETFVKACLYAQDYIRHERTHPVEAEAMDLAVQVAGHHLTTRMLTRGAWPNMVDLQAIASVCVATHMTWRATMGHNGPNKG